MRLILAGALASFGCAAGTHGLPIPDAGLADIAAFIDHDSGEQPDLADHDLAGPHDLASTDLAGTCAPPLVNEVQTGGGGGATDEFVELYSGCVMPFNLAGYKLVYRSATGNTDVTLASFASGMIPASGYYLIANTGYTGTPTPDMTPFSGGAGLKDTGGAVGLRDPSGTLVDSVGWGSANNLFVETAAATEPPSGNSTARHPNGHDSNNNSADFMTSTPTPKASN